MTVRVAGQRLSADVSIEQLTTSAGPTVKLALANVNLALGDGKQDLLTLTNGSGFWLIRSGGVAGRVQGTVALQNVPGVTLQGTLGLEVNTTNADVNETFTLNGFETQARDRREPQVRRLRDRRDARARRRLAQRRLRVHQGHEQDAPGHLERRDRASAPAPRA